MAIIAKLRYLRIAPRKVRLVADLIRKKRAEEARAILKFTTKKATEPLSKLLNTAIADAKHNFQLEEKNLYISKITVDEGPKNKRWMPRGRGAVSEIQKKTSHITLVLDEVEKKPKKAKKEKTKRGKKKPVVLKAEKDMEKIEKVLEQKLETKKPKLRPEAEIPKPKMERGLKRIFRRKAF